MKFQLSQLRTEKFQNFPDVKKILGKPVSKVTTEEYGLKLAPENRKQST